MGQLNRSNDVQTKPDQAASLFGPSIRPPAFWSRLVSTSWYQENLHKCARRALRRSNSPPQWLDDLKHDGMLLLARQLAHAHDGSTAASHTKSRAWLFAATLGHCREALKRMRWANRHARQFHDEEDFPESHDWRLLELRNAIISLDEPLRTILERQAGGLSLKQIARDDGLPYWQVWRLSRRGMEQLCKVLNGSSDM